jgi:hypothetical protein
MQAETPSDHHLNAMTTNSPTTTTTTVPTNPSNFAPSNPARAETPPPTPSQEELSARLARSTAAADLALARGREVMAHYERCRDAAVENARLEIERKMRERGWDGGVFGGGSPRGRGGGGRARGGRGRRGTGRGGLRGVEVDVLERVEEGEGEEMMEVVREGEKEDECEDAGLADAMKSLEMVQFNDGACENDVVDKDEHEIEVDKDDLMNSPIPNLETSTLDPNPADHAALTTSQDDQQTSPTSSKSRNGSASSDGTMYTAYTHRSTQTEDEDEISKEQSPESGASADRARVAEMMGELRTELDGMEWENRNLKRLVMGAMEWGLGEIEEWLERERLMR